MLAHVPDIRVATVADAHPAYAMVQKPEKCAAIVDAFLREHALGSARRGGERVRA